MISRWRPLVPSREGEMRQCGTSGSEVSGLIRTCGGGKKKKKRINRIRVLAWCFERAALWRNPDNDGMAATGMEFR
jgi:hypothetical protein